ncbi:biotin-independent malonate decarboxylase subunit beta [Rhizobium sp. BK376]|uniref:biotin-independent malonate decarboxylase subunit beta n=1 Tax=Rhizobium sp. BK376 TaxID=2512149 RepID=UPI0010433F01|nr:biotin-independent malonate decarboxylase subunit beta [Rhizobium sp. BK376]TCR73390.1 malonate decarboxylase beta subunit [Rhizobium sp. BK376]
MKTSWYEATARERIAGLLDPGSFIEILPPQSRLRSPHLEPLGSPAAFDDGVTVGKGMLDGRSILLAAQEGGFMGGAVGEVHGAKITGLLERALDERPDGVLLLLESGGVRLHEANAGLIAVSEIMRAMLNLRAAALPVIVLDGGRYGVFGGMGIAARLASYIVMSEEGRLGLSGPEVIEATVGVEEFDASDRPLVWRTVGGKHRYLIGEASALVSDEIAAFRQQAIYGLSSGSVLNLDEVETEQMRLKDRLARFEASHDALDMWAALGVPNPDAIPLFDVKEFHKTADSLRIVS